MCIRDREDAVSQVNATVKFKRAILNQGLTEFLEEGDNDLTNGLALPFPILTKVFKGIRKGETMAYAMPSNSGKSRFTINEMCIRDRSEYATWESIQEYYTNLKGITVVEKGTPLFVRLEKEPEVEYIKQQMAK